MDGNEGFWACWQRDYSTGGHPELPTEAVVYRELDLTLEPQPARLVAELWNGNHKQVALAGFSSLARSDGGEMAPATVYNLVAQVKKSLGRKAIFRRSTKGIYRVDLDQLGQAIADCNGSRSLPA